MQTKLSTNLKNMEIVQPAQYDDDTSYLKIDQTTPQTTVGTFTFPAVVSPTLTGGTA